ncbi:MAG: RNA 2',3'-cyclic phosphodiesterase [Methylobacter sp.]|jgi:2'-5' RNA ligase|nr:RNA 2',3'-cyclic phosphodiesterase [Methylobacter sp.]
MSSTSRLFFALWPDSEIRHILESSRQAIISTDFKWVAPHNFHVTLVFLGQVDTATAAILSQAVTDISVTPFTLTFDQLIFWSSPRILCLTCRQSTQLAFELASALETAIASCGLVTDPRPYIPHITLARNARYLPEANIEPIRWNAEAFCLVKSCSTPSGVFYEVLQRWPLITPQPI